MQLPAAPLRQLWWHADWIPAARVAHATTGAGVLAFDGRVFRQILANQDEARNVTALLL